MTMDRLRRIGINASAFIRSPTNRVLVPSFIALTLIMSWLFAKDDSPGLYQIFSATTLFLCFFVGTIGACLWTFEASLMSRSFSFSLPSLIPDFRDLLLYGGLALNLLFFLGYQFFHGSWANAMALLGLCMLANAFFLAPAIIYHVLKSNYSLYSLIFLPFVILFLLIKKHTITTLFIPSAATIPLGILAWSFAWIRFRDRNVHRSLVGRTDFVIAGSWLNQERMKKAREKTSLEKRQETSMAERLSEKVFFSEMTNSEKCVEGKALAGLLYSVLGRFTYKTGMKYLGLVVLFWSFYRWIANLQDPIFIFVSAQFIMIFSTCALLPSTTLPIHFFQLPLSRIAMAKVTIYWDLFRSVFAAIIILGGFALLAVLVPGAPGTNKLNLLTFAVVPFYVYPLLMIVELLSPNQKITSSVLSSVLIVLLVFLQQFSPASSALLFSTLNRRIIILFALWGLLSALVVWRFRRFDLRGNMDPLKQAWNRRFQKGL